MRKRKDFYRMTVLWAIAAALIAALFPGCAKDKSSEPKQETVIRFGTLPVIQALPLFVAAEKGFFSEQGVRVELESFQSATEKDVALSSGQISGYFGDLLTPMVLRANGAPIKIVAQNFNTTGSRRMFAIVAGPQSPAASLADAARAGIAAGSNTIVEYLTASLLKAKNIPERGAKLIEIKSIPIRFQMLMSGQVPAAALPEPLVTLAERQGGRVLADDAGLGLSATVLVFNEEMIRNHPALVRAFLRAVDQAATWINVHPEEARAVMNRDCRIPEALQKSFAIPSFPPLTVPAAAHWKGVYDWLRQKKMITGEITYEQTVDHGAIF